MKKSEVFSGSSIEEAKAKAVQSFGVDEDKIVFTVIEDVKKGLFGRIKSEAKVEAVYEEPAAKPLEEEKETGNSYEAVKETVNEDNETEPEEAKEPVEVPEEKIEICKAFLEKTLTKMGIEYKLDVKAEDGGIFIDILSDGSGTIIGRRGETLDSLQYLCSLVVNKSEGDYIRITLDSCGYRAKRTETLKQLAQKISNKVMRTGRSTVLEPMNPYERRVIHSEVAAIEGVNSKSIGDEPYRKVIISSVNAKHGGYRKGGHGRNGRNNNRHREPRSIDLKSSFETSFEKDYKKPKPEDDINAGLYGKIEI